MTPMTTTARLRSLLLAGMLPAALAHVDIAWSRTPTDTTVCQLAAHGADFDGRYVRLDAIYMTDLMHFSFLKDRRCPRAIVDEDDDDARNDANASPSVKAFREAVWSVVEGDETGLDVEVSGVFRWQLNWQPPRVLAGVMKPGQRGLLVVDRVWKFKRMRGDWQSTH